jgi:hypothetical protein
MRTLEFVLSPFAHVRTGNQGKKASSSFSGRPTQSVHVEMWAFGSHELGRGCPSDLDPTRKAASGIDPALRQGHQRLARSCLDRIILQRLF